MLLLGIFDFNLLYELRTLNYLRARHSAKVTMVKAISNY